MTDKIEKKFHGKTPGLINPETYVLTHNRVNSILVLVFIELEHGVVLIRN